MTLIEISLEVDQEKKARWKLWILLFILTLLFHLLLVLIPLESPSTRKPPPVEIQNIDPAKLEAIRKQWRQKQLILDRDPLQKSLSEAPKDAHAISNRNVKVEKEQRAKDSTLIPRPGRPQNQDRTKDTARDNTPVSRQKMQLSRLGIPFQLSNSAPSEPQGGQQTILDDQVPVGGENLLNTESSIYYSFYARMYEAIGPLWSSRIQSLNRLRQPRPGDYVTVVDVVLDEAGNLIEVRSIKGSGIAEFDQAVEESWKKVGRFLNPPRGLLNSQKQIHTGWTFMVRVGNGFNLLYLPPERNF